MSIFLECEDILAGPQNLNGLFEGEDLVLRVRFQLDLG